MIPAGNELARAAWAQAWQVTTLIVVVAVLTRLVARNRPHLAHALWLIVLVKCVTPPVWSSTSGVFCWLQSGSMERPTQRSSEVASPAGAPVDQESVLPLPEAVSASRGESRFQTESGPSGDEVVLSGVEPAGRREPVRGEIEATPTERSRSGRTTAALLGGWLLGTLVVLGVAAVRWAGCLRQLRRSGFVTDRSYDRLMTSLSRRLKLWWPARLVVTTGRVGPAVIGLFRPTVLLPEIVVRGKSAEDLEPILAHELIHVRRGDMWTGMLQTLGQAVWWFHPLVWWAGRLASREAERCCDEAVVAELGCNPARYARCLVDVLERKQDVKPLPAFPGVRPVEVTSRRMERIMRLGQGSRKRNPWWCWAVMILAAAVSLPGAALVVGADDEGAAEERPEADTSDLPALKQVGDEAPATAGPRVLPGNPDQRPGAADASGRRSAAEDEPQPVITRIYRVDDLLDAVRSAYHLDRRQAKARLLRTLGRAGWGTRPASTRRRLEWSDETLVVRETARGQERFADALESARKYGFDQIEVQVYFMAGTAKTIEMLDVNWQLLPTEVSTAETPQEAADAASTPVKGPLPERDSQPRRNRAQVIVEKNLPVTTAVLDEKQMKTVLERFQDDRRANILQAPRVRLTNGRSACVSNSSRSPFVVGLKDGQPQIRVVSEGSFVRVRPLLDKENSLRLDYDLTMSKIRGVEITSFSFDQGQTHTSLQVPEVETTRVEGSVKLPAGNALLIGGLKTKDADRPSMLVMLRATKVEPKRPVARDPDLYTKTYAVADLVVPLPQKIVLSTGSVETKEKPKRSSADFDSLIELITSTIEPRTWDEAGGSGSIAPFDTNLSLVVSQTGEVHEEIADLLEQLRRLRDRQVALDTEIVRMPQEMVERIGIELAPKTDATVLAPREARMFRAIVAKSATDRVRLLSKMTLLNGQFADVPFADVQLQPEGESRARGESLVVQPVVSGDRRFVRLDLAVRSKDRDDASALRTVVSVGDGHTVLLDVTGRLQPRDRAVGVPVLPLSSTLFRQIPGERSTEKTYLLVTPKIVVVEEEEERVAASRR